MASPAGNRIESQINDISKLFFYPLPTRPTKVVRAMRVMTTHVVIGEKGKIHTSQVRAGCYWVKIARPDQTVQALIALGMLSNAAVEQHKAAAEDERDAQRRRYAADSVLENADLAGLILTKTQRTKLEKSAAKPVRP